MNKEGNKNHSDNLIACSVQFSPVAQSCLTPWTETCQASLSITTPGACSNSCPLSWWCYPTISFYVVLFSSCLWSFPASRSFLTSQFFVSGRQSIGSSALASVHPVNIQDWFPLGLTGWIFLQFKELSRVFSNTQFRSINFSVLSFLYTPILTSIHDYCKNHGFDWMDICQQSNVSAF